MTPAETEIRSVPDAAAGTSIGGVTLGRELGRGGMAVVYEGMDPGFSPPRQVAVKLMAPKLSADPEFRVRFEREASLVAGFRHDNIIHVFASGDAGGAKYIVMEYLPGGNLASKIARGELAARDAVATGAMLADSLAYSHSRGVVHRDFKPGNVLFTAEGKPVLSDFGIAKTSSGLQTALTQYSAVIGAPRYMAPEQERGEPVTDRADVFSFGLTLFEMLTGGLPPPLERVLRTAGEGKHITASLGKLPAEAFCSILPHVPALGSAPNRYPRCRGTCDLDRPLTTDGGANSAQLRCLWRLSQEFWCGHY
jgi:serine/threonine protein kinase